MHAALTISDKLFVYGGTDFNSVDADVSELWYINPLVQLQPSWHKIEIKDPCFCLPDGIKGHQMMGSHLKIDNANRKVVYVIGG